MKKRYYIVIAALLFGASVAKAQDHIKLDLQKTIQLANDSSLEASVSYTHLTLPTT